MDRGAFSVLSLNVTSMVPVDPAEFPDQEFWRLDPGIALTGKRIGSPPQSGRRLAAEPSLETGDAPADRSGTESRTTSLDFNPSKNPMTFRDKEEFQRSAIVVVASTPESSVRRKSDRAKITFRKKKTTVKKPSVNREAETRDKVIKENGSTRKIKVNWRRLKDFQSYRDNDGTWVECCREECLKWRYLPDVKDPSTVPVYWECSMNNDKTHSTCEVPQSECFRNFHLVENKFTTGTVVWAFHPQSGWWPAMVDDDPETKQFVRLEHDLTQMEYGSDYKPSLYHVQYFDSGCLNVARSWVMVPNIVEYQDLAAAAAAAAANGDKAVVKVKRTSWKQGLAEAMATANWLQTKSLLTRRKYFCFHSPLRGQLKRPKVIDGRIHLKEGPTLTQERTISSRRRRSTTFPAAPRPDAGSDQRTAGDEDPKASVDPSAGKVY